MNCEALGTVIGQDLVHEYYDAVWVVLVRFV